MCEMSYDIGIGSTWFNYTSNVAKLFYDHIPARDSRGGLHELDGKTGKQAGDILADAFDRIQKTKLETWRSGVVGEPEFCARYDSPNGWGSTVGALILLSQVMAACYQNPRKRVSVDA